MQTKPGEQPQRADALVSCGTTGPVLDGGAHTKASRIVTVLPGAVNVVVIVLVGPGRVVTTVVPARVRVVMTPGRIVV